MIRANVEFGFIIIAFEQLEPFGFSFNKFFLNGFTEKVELWHFVKTTAISFFSMNWTCRTKYLSHFKHLRNKTGLNLADKRRILYKRLFALPTRTIWKKVYCLSTRLPRFPNLFFVKVHSAIKILNYYKGILKSYEIIHKPFNDTSPINQCCTSFFLFN